MCLSLAKQSGFGQNGIRLQQIAFLSADCNHDCQSKQTTSRLDRFDLTDLKTRFSEDCALGNQSNGIQLSTIT